MVRIIHRTTGVEMQVADERVQEFLARGHSLAEAPKPVKKPARKATRKKKG